jgi:hypothetical protein
VRVVIDIIVMHRQRSAGREYIVAGETGLCTISSGCVGSRICLEFTSGADIRGRCR